MCALMDLLHLYWSESSKLSYYWKVLFITRGPEVFSQSLRLSETHVWATSNAVQLRLNLAIVVFLFIYLNDTFIIILTKHYGRQ